MAHSGHPRGPGSPRLPRHREEQLGVPHGRQLPYGAEDDEDWETDPDYRQDASRPWREHEISTASIISDLSRSIQDVSLGKSSPCSGKAGTDHQSHLFAPGGKHGKAAEGHRPPPLCPHVHSSPNLGIERSSLFNHNAAEKLDTFFSEKLKAWASDTARLSDTEAAQEEPTSSCTPCRTAKNGPADHKPEAGRQKHRRAAHERGHAGAGQANRSCGHYHPGLDHCLRPHWHRALGKGEASEGLSHRQEGSRPSPSVSGSARILPQCRISHVQSCRACQAFNQDGPAGKGNTRVPLQEEEGGGTGVPLQKGRTPLPCQQHARDRISKVQQWLEQTPLEPHPAPLRRQHKHRAPNLASPEAQQQLPARGSTARREGEPWRPALDAAGDHPSRGVAAEARHLGKSHHEGGLKHPPDARVLPGDDASTSPASCSCLVCQRQRPRAQLLAAQDGPDPSAEEVAARLQAENRVPRIVEAFERRSLREAKIAERERARQAALQRDSERRRRAEAKRGPPAGGPTKAPGPRPEEQPRPRARKEREAVGKQPSFLDRLRGRR